MEDLYKFLGKDINIQKISGGVTNKVYLLQNGNEKYIYRIYGKNSDILIDREHEIRYISFLNNFNIGPKNIKIFKNSRIEEFIEGKTITNLYLNQKLIANYIHNLHSINYEKKHNFKNFWNIFYSWSNIVDSNLKHCVNKIIDIIKKNNFWNQNVLGHGDLTPGNILMFKENIQLIDFEYSCILPRGFEIANHLCEYNGLEIDLNTYPEKEKRISFIKHYIQNLKPFENIDLEIIDLFSLISHYYWGCWGLIMYQNSEDNTDFNYLEYSNKRFEMFNHYKNLFIK